MRKTKAIVFSLLSFFSTFLYANPYQDFMFWSALTATGPLENKDYRYWLEGQARFGEDVSHLTQTFFRPGLGYVLSKESSIWFGYGYFYTSRPLADPSVYEHRLWQQFLWSSSFNDVGISSRTRLEQRKAEGNANIGWRFREAIKLTKPFSEGSKHFLFASDEIFIHLRHPNTDELDPVFDQNRLSLGIGSHLSKNLTADVSYMKLNVNSFDSDPSFQANVIVLNFSLNFA